MKARFIYTAILFFSFFQVSVNSQRLTTGFYSGINFSDIHGSSQQGSWKPKPGPSEGIFIDYSVNRFLGIRTGAGYYTLYYQYVPPAQLPPPIYYQPLDIWYPWYPQDRKMDFSFVSIPVQVRVSLPSVARLDLMAGVYRAFLVDHSPGPYTYYPESYEPTKNDFGFSYSLAWTLPLTESFDVSLTGSYKTGRRRIDEYYNYRHGYTDIRMGISWNGILKNQRDYSWKPDTTSNSERVSLIYRGGASVNWNAGETNREKYSPYTGFSAGLLAGINLGKSVSLRSGVVFDRTGFSLRDSSDSFYHYLLEGEAYYKTETRTSVDFLTIPLLLHFTFGADGKVFLNTGPYIALKLNARCRGTIHYAFNYEGSYSRYKRTVNEDLEGIIRDNEFGWIFGAGYSIQVLKYLALEPALQYRTGFGELFSRPYLNDTGFRYDSGTVFKTSSLSLVLGLRVPVFK